MKRILSLVLCLCLLMSLAPVVALAAETRTIYFDNSRMGWSQINVYSWNDRGDCTGSWPGSAMTLVEDGIYAFEVPVDATQIIFNNGSNEQTDDLTIPTDGKNLCDGIKWYVYAPAVPAEQGYYLAGYINGVDYGSVDDQATLGQYLFQDGKLTVTFTQDSYVFVKTIDTWYMAQSYCTDTTCTLINTALGSGEKMFVPGGIEVTFTLKVVDEDTLTLSYKTAEPACDHSWRYGFCNICKQYCDHNYENGKCTICSEREVPAFYLVGYINGANYGCEEDEANMGKYKFENGRLVATFEQDSYVFLKTEGNREWFMSRVYSTGNQCNFYHTSSGANEKMFVPGGVEITFTVSWYAEGTYTIYYTTAAMACTHKSHNQDGICDSCGGQLVHTYINGVCSCGKVEEVQPTLEYFLFGYINGANYACEEDASNMGEYKFVDGQLVAKFNCDSYVGVKTTGNADWFMTNGYAGTYGVARLYNASTLGNPDKLYVPGNVTVIFTLTVNRDNTLTLEYKVSDTPPATRPTLKAEYPTVSFEDMIVLNVYFSASNTEDVTEMGLMIFSGDTITANVEKAQKVLPGYTWNESAGLNVASTDGIAAKQLGSIICFAVYAKLSDGTYAYSKLVRYSVLNYATSQLNTGSAAMKALMVATLNYGAAAQKNFTYSVDNLVNAGLTSAQQALVKSYSSSMISNTEKPSTSKLGAMQNNGGYTNRYATVSFEGAFSINYYFAPSATPKGNITMYVWTQADYKAASSLNKSNASYTITMKKQANGEYLGTIEDIAAKNLNDAVYVSFCYSDGTTSYCSGVSGYSIGQYCKSLASGTGTMAELAKATAVYGYYAKQRFG